ncbi:hypothetical protein [Tenacibaculum sp. Bg11-29]|nr:hypothetical protein [Tenacibaculum sp. Bg11-29]
MLKNISNLGSVLNKTEQQLINGGNIHCCMLLVNNCCDPKIPTDD